MMGTTANCKDDAHLPLTKKMMHTHARACRLQARAGHVNILLCNRASCGMHHQAPAARVCVRTKENGKSHDKITLQCQHRALLNRIVLCR
jgi:hypothetical protein